MDEKAVLALANKFDTSQEEIHQAHKEFLRGSDDDDSPSNDRFNKFLESSWFSVDAVPEPVEGRYGKKKRKNKKSKAQVPPDDFFDFSEMTGASKPVVVGKKADFFDSPDPDILTGAQRQIKSTDFNDFSDDDEDDYYDDNDDSWIDDVLDVDADLPSTSTLTLSVPRDPVVRVERTSSTADEFAEKMAALSLEKGKMPSGASKSVAFRESPKATLVPKAGGSKEPGGSVDVYIPPQVVGF